MRRRINNYAVKNTKDKEEEIDGDEYEAWIKNMFVSLFRYRHIKENNDNKYMKILLLNASSVVVFAIAYLGKFALDIVNIDNEIYEFPKLSNFVYIVIMIVFFTVEYLKNNLAEFSVLLTLLEVFLFGIGIYAFVYTQYGNINLKSLMVTIYGITPYMLNCHTIANKYKLK